MISLAPLPTVEEQSSDGGDGAQCRASRAVAILPRALQGGASSAEHGSGATEPSQLKTLPYGGGVPVGHQFKVDGARRPVIAGKRLPACAFCCWSRAGRCAVLRREPDPKSVFSAPSLKKGRTQNAPFLWGRAPGGFTLRRSAVAGA
jgi:hypothetical protein